MLKKAIFKVVILVLVVGLAACMGSKPVEDTTPSMSDAEISEELLGKVWVAEYIQGKPVVDASHTSIIFNADNSVKGRGGCNSYAGRYTLENGAIMFSPLAATMKMCAPALDDQEIRFFKALEGKQTIWFKNGLLHMSTDGESPSIFSVYNN